MSLSGPQALSSLEEALRDIRREEDEIARRLAKSNEVVSKFRESEAELFRQLAMVRLDPSAQAQLTERISQVEVKARDRLKQQAIDISETEEKLTGIDARIADVGAERSRLLTEIGTRQDELKALSSKIAAAIAADPNFAGKRQDAREMAAIAEESLNKTEQAQTDRETKGRPYREDPLFMYLWERGYGTSKYNAGNLVRYFDGLVAGMINYARARPNFAMLNELPVRLREHAEQQAENASQAEAELVALETQAIDSAGGKPIREAILRANQQIAALDAQLVELEDERDENAKLLRQLAQGNDPSFDEAIGALAQSLGREDLQTLLSEARRTHTAQDDTLVAQIDELRARAREELAQSSEQKERLKTLASRRRELEDIQYEFKKARFDDPRSSFGEDSLVGDLLTDFLRGGITAATYWNHWQKSQNWRSGSTEWGGGIGVPGAGGSPWSDRGGGFSWPDTSIGGGSGGGSFGGGSSGGGFSWPKSSGSRNSGGGGFSRPRTSTIGTRKHGGFKTGGGF